MMLIASQTQMSLKNGHVSQAEHVKKIKKMKRATLACLTARISELGFTLLPF